jgi:hypothetical protein
MITFAEVKASTREERTDPMEDLELAISKLIDTYRNKSARSDAVNALRTQAELTARDETWTASSPEEADRQKAAQKEAQAATETPETDPTGDPAAAKKRR